MSKSADQALKSTEKALKKIAKLAKKNRETFDQQMDRDGMTTMFVFKETKDRYRENYEQRAPASLLLALAMDAVDAGTLQLPSPQEALEWFRQGTARGRANAKSEESKPSLFDALNDLLSKKSSTPGTLGGPMTPYMITPEGLAKGVDHNGNPIPPGLREALQGALGSVLPPKPKEPPLPTEQPPDQGEQNVIRFGSDPGETPDESDKA